MNYVKGTLPNFNNNGLQIIQGHHRTINIISERTRILPKSPIYSPAY